MRIARTAMSNEDGRYVLPNLPIGPYKLEVNAPGFALRGEAFNLTNSYRAGPVTANLSSPQFGQILTAQDPRIIQVAGKFVF